MEDKQVDQWLRQLRSSLEEKGTEELLDIWKKNNRQEWTDDAFKVIRQILLARTGSLPPQRELSAADQAEGVAKEEAVDEETYYDFDKITRIASLAKTISWVFLGLFILLIVGDVIIIGEALIRSYSWFNPWSPVMSSLVPMLFAGFFFVLLQAIAEGLYVLLDIEDNTRRAAMLSKDRSR